MLELYKKVLKGVSFDGTLFRKELMKARKWVGKQDEHRLKLWCLTSFGAMHGKIIEEVFNQLP